MDKHIAPEFLNAWNAYGFYIAVAIASLGTMIGFCHYLKLLITRDYKNRYDYINRHEIKLLWRGVLLILIGIMVFFNTILDDSLWIWFFVRLFMSIMITLILGVIFNNILKYYYPFFIEKRLKRLRYTPRKAPNGNLMKLLSEEEEDVYLDEGMQAEENTFSIDYDVWKDEESGYTKIEKYNGRLHALRCQNCDYQTLKVEREEVIQPANTLDEGELMKYYLCTYCSHKERKSFKIAILKNENK